MSKIVCRFSQTTPRTVVKATRSNVLALADGFNKEAVNKYFRNVNEIVTKHKVDGTKVYNMDETGLSTVQRPSKVVCLKGKKRAGALIIHHLYSYTEYNRK